MAPFAKAKPPPNKSTTFQGKSFCIAPQVNTGGTGEADFNPANKNHCLNIVAFEALPQSLPDFRRNSGFFDGRKKRKKLIATATVPSSTKSSEKITAQPGMKPGSRSSHSKAVSMNTMRTVLSDQLCIKMPVSLGAKRIAISEVGLGSISGWSKDTVSPTAGNRCGVSS